MGTKAFNILFQENEEDNGDDPIKLLDFEENTVICGSQNYLRNITIEDPGYIVNVSSEDYEERQQNSMSLLKESKTPIKNSGYINNNDDLLSKCRNCSIKLIDCHKFPWYYQNKIGSTNNTQHPNTKHNDIEIKEEKDKEEIKIIDLTNEEHVQYNNVSKEKIAETNWNEVTSFDNSVGKKVRKDKSISVPILIIRNESDRKVPIREPEQDSDLIISAYSRTIDKDIQKLKNSIESTQNKTNISSKFLLGSKSFVKNRVNFSQATKEIEKIAKVLRRNNNTDSKIVHHKKKNSKNSINIKNIYTSEPISKTKLKIIKNSVKSKEVIPHKNYDKDMEQKGCSPHINVTNNKQCDYIKTIEKNRKSLTNKNEQNHCENKLDKVQPTTNKNGLLSSPVLTKIIDNMKKSTSISNQNIGHDRIHDCNKQLFSANRIIPHFHKNTYLNHPNIVSKSNTKCHDRSRETMNNNTMKNRKSLNFVKDFNMDSGMVSQIPNASINQTIYGIENNNTLININKPQKDNNTNVDVSNNSAFYSVNPSHVTNKLPVNNEMISKESHSSPDIITEGVNNTDFLSQNKIEAPQLGEERLRYLLPSNCKIPDPQMQNIFAYYDGSNSNTSLHTYKHI